MVKTLDASLQVLAERRLEEAYPYLILDARHKPTRQAGVIVRPGWFDRIGGGLGGPPSAAMKSVNGWRAGTASILHSSGRSTKVWSMSSGSL